MRSLFALAASCVLALAACHGQGTPAPKPDPAAVATVDPGTHGLLPATDVVLGRSIYALDEKLVDQDGKPATLDSFRGHPVIISMFYASCPAACPMLISHVKQIEAKLDPAVRADVRVLLVSFDAKNDTPEALRGVIARHQLDTARWKLTVASEDQSREIGAVLGIKYRSEDGGFRHSSVITLLDREGRIVQRSDGLSDENAAVAAKVATIE